MKYILAVSFIAGFVAGEVPSHSYLPPPPNRGYSSGPAVVAARVLEHESGDHHAANGFARSTEPGPDYSSPAPQARFGGDQGYDQSSTAYPRNGLDDVNATANYEADEQSFKPEVSYEDSVDLARSNPGYDTNANNFRANGYQDGGQNDAYGVEQNGGRSNARSNGYN